MEYVKQNAHIWDKRAENNDIWSQPVSREIIEAARNGTWSIEKAFARAIRLRTIYRDRFPPAL